MQIKKKGIRFSKNIFTDKESSFISNPEYVAEHMAKTIQILGNYHVGVELCCCIGMNVIQMAKVFEKMIGIDLNENRINMARKNAQVYGVSSNTEFIVGDVLDKSLLSTIHADFAILDPEWSARLMDRSSHVSSIHLTNPSLKNMFDLTKNILPLILLQEFLEHLILKRLRN